MLTSLEKYIIIKNQQSKDSWRCLENFVLLKILYIQVQFNTNTSCANTTRPKKTWEQHILMELMEGEDMDVYLKEQGRPYVIDRVQDVGGQLISGLRYLHERKIIHQDLKPQNILFSNDYEKIKLVDFGVSTRFDKTRATRAAQAGTLRYMPPEQLNGSLSFKTDIWAFGCVLL